MSTERKNQNDTVTIKLFKDGDKYKDDLTVGVNGRFFKIQRGVPVTVPRYVAEVVDAHLRAETESNLHRSELAGAYEGQARILQL